jgi:hypothetical protein
LIGRFAPDEPLARALCDTSDARPREASAAARFVHPDGR